jgi:hypothetical protein
MKEFLHFVGSVELLPFPVFGNIGRYYMAIILVAEVVSVGFKRMLYLGNPTLQGADFLLLR